VPKRPWHTHVSDMAVFETGGVGVRGHDTLDEFTDSHACHEMPNGITLFFHHRQTGVPYLEVMKRIEVMAAEARMRSLRGSEHLEDE
jgi:hypothetical protein